MVDVDFLGFYFVDFKMLMMLSRERDVTGGGVILKNQNVWIFYSCIKTATMGT
jgi:hypothetical protein